MDKRPDDDQFPEPNPGPSIERLKTRGVVSALVALLQLVVFRDAVAASRRFLWPPTDPISQWLTFVLISAGSFVVISVLIGTIVGDRLHDRWRA